MSCLLVSTCKRARRACALRGRNELMRALGARARARLIMLLTGTYGAHWAIRVICRFVLSLRLRATVDVAQESNN